jgi:hypothetical protein
MSEDQIKDRQKRAKRESYKRKFKANLPKLLRLFLLGVIFVTLYYIFTQTSIFNVKEIEVTGVGNKSLNYADATEIDQFLSESFVDVNFFTLDPEELRVSLVESFPFVRSSWVEKVFPVGLLVTVEEKTPYMHVQFLDECYLIDQEDSVIISLTDVAQEGDEPLTCEYFSDKYGSLTVNVSKDDYDTIFTDSGGFILFEQIYQANELLKDNGYTPNSYILLERELQIRDEGGRTLIFDPFGDFDDQLKRFVLVFNQGDGLEDFRVIDFRYERPVLRE